MRLTARRGVMHRDSILAVAVVLLIFGASAGYVYSQNRSQSQTTKLQTVTTTTQAIQTAISSDVSVGLTVKLYSHNGTLITERDLPHDLILDQFNKWLLAVFMYGTGATQFCATYACYAIGDTITTPTSGAYCTTPSYCGVVLAIGTGSTVTRADTALQTGYTPSGGNLYFADTAENPLPTTTATPATCNTGATDTITGISGSQSITGTVTITEAGAFFSGAYGAANYDYMIFHDSFTGISAAIGDTVTVAYTVNLSNSGFDGNFCSWLAGMLTGNIAQFGHVTISLTSTSNAAASFYTWCNIDTAPQGAVYTTGCASASDVAKMKVGTGSSAFTTSSIDLSNPVGSITAIAADTYTSPVPFWTTTFTGISGDLISEAGMYLTLSSSNYMFFATTFTGQTASSAYGVTMRIGD